MEEIDSIKLLTYNIKERVLETNQLRYELNNLDRDIEKAKQIIDYDIAFNKELKNAEQRDVQRKADYKLDEDLQQMLDNRNNKSKELKDCEALLEYLRNLFKVDIILLSELEKGDQ